MPQSSKKSVVSDSRQCPFTDSHCVYPCDKMQHARMVIGKSDDDMIEHLNVNRTTWWRWRRGEVRPPFSVCAYLSVLTGKFPWSNWETFFFNQRDQKLYFHDYRYGLSLSDLKAYWWQIQELQLFRKSRSEDREEASEASSSVISLKVKS